MDVSIVFVSDPSLCLYEVSSMYHAAVNVTTTSNRVNITTISTWSRAFIGFDSTPISQAHTEKSWNHPIRHLPTLTIYLSTTPSYLSIPYTLFLSKMTAAVSRPSIPLGSSVPPMTAHAVSVSLPTWKDNVGYEEGDKRVMDKLETGYPRFFVHRSIQKVSSYAQI